MGAPFSWIAPIFRPVSDDPFAAMLGDDGFAAGPHRLVWVDITIL